MQELQSVDVRYVAEQLAVSARTIHRLIASGELPSFKIGRRRLVRVAALRSWLAGQEKVSEQAG